MTTHRVTGCDDCPLCVGEHDGEHGDGCAWCSAAGENQTRCVGTGRRQIQSLPYEPGAPDWCPLRTDDLLLHLEVPPCK